MNQSSSGARSELVTGAPVRVVTVNAGLGNPSSTRLLADQLGDATARALADLGVEAQVDTVDLRLLAHPLADALLTGFPTGDLAEAVRLLGQADAVIAVTPVFQASYSGLFKTFFDVLDRDLLVGKPLLMAATAGSARHSLVLEHALRPLFAHLRAITVPTAVFAASEDFGSTADGSLTSRVRRAAGELAGLAAPRVGGTPSARAPQVSAGHGELPEPTPFAEMLARI